MAIKSWEEGKAEARAEGRAEGRAEARAEVLREVILLTLCARGVAVPDAARERILAQRDAEQMDRWLRRAALATSIGEVLDAP